MIDVEKVVKALECCIENERDFDGDGGCNECPYADIIGTCEELTPLLTDALTLLDAMWRDLQTTKSCAVCRHRDECDPNADEYDPAWQCYHDCVGPFKLNWEWRGPTDEAKEVAWYV